VWTKWQGGPAGAAAKGEPTHVHVGGRGVPQQGRSREPEHIAEEKTLGKLRPAISSRLAILILAGRLDTLPKFGGINTTYVHS
jgi:hypothetical protein